MKRIVHASCHAEELSTGLPPFPPTTVILLGPLTRKGSQTIASEAIELTQRVRGERASELEGLKEQSTGSFIFLHG